MRVKRPVVFLLGMLMACSVFANKTQLTQLRVNRKPHEWRFVFHTRGPIHYESFTLNNPPRIVVDIKNATLRENFQYSQYVNTPVKNIRIGHHLKKHLRLVLDLRYPVKLKTFVVPGSGQSYSRLVVDLVGYNKQKVLGFSWPAPQATVASAPLPVDTVPPKAMKLRPRNIIVVIDPGHGGKDPGATGRRGTHEKNIVLKLAQDLRRMINHQRGFTAVLTRSADYYIPLRKRLSIARKYKADMFVSIHADAYRHQHARGASVYALSQRGVTSEAARWLAKRENESELMGGVDLSDKTNLLRSVLINLSQTATIRASLQIGQDMIQALSKITRLHHNRVEQAAFVVLKSPDIPSLLVESGFISNPREERKLRSGSYRNKIARAIMLGVKNYFTHRPPRGTWLSSQKHHQHLAAQHYRVAPGDTLYGIAARFHVKVAELRRVNHLRGSSLRIGQVLTISSKT